ncbi:hypothetical protein XELAEV_18041876mg [Xenopus laevis]|uniref:Uncharacterized protein n=1 Tax=Xenopus laevis TaxID=8355 RepID=A0A974C382_XENLA|nr:hypothetical protein XELAEV_18041876mg [Xenopus laevis]
MDEITQCVFSGTSLTYTVTSWPVPQTSEQTMKGVSAIKSQTKIIGLCSNSSYDLTDLKSNHSYLLKVSPNCQGPVL